MPIANLKALMIDLHDSFGDDETSSQQQQLMQQLQSYVHDIDTAEPAPPGLIESAEILIDEMEEGHPKTAAIIRQVINALGNIGI
jgi:RAB protein geranylgeranyltransferase component A